MRTAVALLFIAGVAGAAIWLATKPTIADGRVMEAELMPLIRGKGVVGIECDRRIPISRSGAEFRCTAILSGGRSQALDCRLDREGRLTAKPAGARSAIPASGDPWGD